MYTTRLEYKFKKYKYEIIEGMNNLFSIYYKNGQIINSTWLMSRNGKIFEVFVSLPEKRALSAANSNIYADKCVKKLDALGLDSITIDICRFDPGSNQTCSCKSRSAYILYTDYMTLESPLRCFDCFNPIPLYKINRGNDSDYLDILHWKADYQACDTLQMHCTTGERFGERQLFDYNSSLTKQGLSICSELNQMFNKPVYYYLLKSRGQSLLKEKKRICPNCKNNWFIPEPIHNKFNFKCDKCQLLSNIAFNDSI